jgi:2-dehydropantoate 2-reductase
MSVLDEAQLKYSRASTTHVPSMFVDAEKDQPIEVEVILGELVRMAKEFNVEIPVAKIPHDLNYLPADAF